MFKSDQIDASNFVQGVDSAFIFIIAICVVFLVGLTITMLYFVFRYRKDKHPKAIQDKGSMTLEIIWTAIPTAIVLLMFWFGWMGWKPMTKVPADAMEVKAIARMWNFRFEYENGKSTDTLYVPMNKPVKLDLVALDVLHGIYIPAFRVKEDMVPGKEKMMWFNPMRPGKFDLFCSEYCGLSHSYMYTSVVVMEQDDFDKWYTDTTAVALVADTSVPGAIGRGLLNKHGCLACHSLDGSKLVGPSFYKIYDLERVVKEKGGEKKIKTTDDYILSSIYEPNSQIVEGYNKGLMLSYKDLISEQEVEEIIVYLKTLSN